MHQRFVSSGILRHGRAILVLFFLVPGLRDASAQQAAPAPEAPAQKEAPNDITVEGQFDSYDGTSTIGVVTQKPTAEYPHKMAALGVKYQHSDKNYQFDGSYSTLSVAFSPDDWQKFVALWKKALAAREEADVGDYFDGQTLLTVGTTSHGEISFGMGANPDANNIPQDMYIFFLSSKDFDAFDATVKKTSAYFEK